MTTAERHQVGVCILRVEVRPDHLLITITTNRNLDRNLYSARTDPAVQVVDPDKAVQVTADFLHSFG